MAHTTLTGWHEAEWFDIRDGDYRAAYSASDSQFLVEADVMLLHDGAWFWRVMATSHLSEWPELLGAGRSASKDAAMSTADAAATKACAGRSPRTY